MTDEAQIAALNELAGWRLEKHHNQWDVEAMDHRSWDRWIGPDEDSEDEPPDWLNSLDALQTIVNRLDGPTRSSIFLLLMAKVQPGQCMLDLTTKQCAEAILRATGKWKE